MFADCIKSSIHPATWAVFGLKKVGKGMEVAHRGTGFTVDTNGHMLTCWHVTYMDQDFKVACDEFIVMQPELGAVQYRAKLVAKDKERDVALLKIEAGPRTRAVRLMAAVVPFGRSCCAFGHPLSITDKSNGSMRVFTRAAAGTVSMPYQAPRFSGTKPIALYELDFFTHGGSSGGPIFLQNGDVFSFVSGSMLLDDGSGKKVRSNLSMAIDIREAIEFLKPLNINLKTRGSGGWKSIAIDSKRHVTRLVKAFTNIRS